MKAADAITAIESTLRPGRYVAVRIPSRETGHHPWPRTGCRAGRRSTNARNESVAPSSADPAPKNAPAAAMALDAPPASNAIARIAKTTASHSGEKVRLKADTTY